MMLTSKILILLGIALLFMLTLPIVSQGFSGPCISTNDPGVYLYEHRNYQGACTRFTESLNRLASSNVGNNTTSSIRIVGNYTAILYNHPNFESTSTKFAGDDRNFTDDPIGHDRASSILVIPQLGICNAGDGVYLFEHPECEGIASRITADVANLNGTNVDNNKASSIAIGGDYAVTLYPFANFRGAGSTFVSSSLNLGNTQIGDNRASSLRFRPSNCDDDPGVYLYQHSNYRGRCSKFTTSIPNLTIEYVLNDTVSSLRIIGDYAVGVYREANFRGENAIFRSNEPNFGNTLVGHDQASSVRIISTVNLCDGQPGVYLYQQINFQGECTKFIDRAGNLAIHLIGTNQASSIRLVGNYRGRVYADTSFGGTNVTFFDDNPNLGDTLLGDNNASSIVVTGPNPEQESVFRVLLKITTADIETAGTDDDVMVSLNPDNVTWLDYGVIEDYVALQGPGLDGFDGHDFERGETFAYDLTLTGVSLINDIEWLTLAKTGGDSWCVEQVEMIVNDVNNPIFIKTFDPCVRLNNNILVFDNNNVSVTIPFSELRADDRWLEYDNVPENSAFINSPEMISRIHSIVGNVLHDNDRGKWGQLQGLASVEVKKAEVEGGVHVDLDLTGDVPGLFDPEIDVDFDIVFSCRVEGNQGVIHLAIDKVEVEVDFDNIVEIIAFIFGLEDKIAEEIEAGFPDTARGLNTGQPLCPVITILDDGSVQFLPA